MRNLCVVCDNEADYAQGLMEYQNRRKNIPLEMVACTSSDKLKKISDERSIDILLVAERSMSDDIYDVKAGKLIILTEGCCNDNYSDVKHISKYQSCDNLFREVMSGIENEKDSQLNFGIINVCRNVYGVFSPWDSDTRNIFALALGTVLSKKDPTLYINMNSFSGIDEVLEMDTQRGLSDLLYYARQNKNKILSSLAGMAQQKNGLDCIPAAASPEDITFSKGEEWGILLSEIIERSRYVNLVLDFGSDIKEPEKIMEKCTKIFVPFEENTFTGIKRNGLKKYLSGSRAEYSDKFFEVSIPTFDHGNGMNGLWDEISFGENAMCAVNALEGEKQYEPCGN